MDIQHIIESPGEVFWYRDSNNRLEVWCLGGLLHCRVWAQDGELLAETRNHPFNEPVREAITKAWRITEERARS